MSPYLIHQSTCSSCSRGELCDVGYGKLTVELMELEFGGVAESDATWQWDNNARYPERGNAPNATGMLAEREDSSDSGSQPTSGVCQKAGIRPVGLVATKPPILSIPSHAGANPAAAISTKGRE